MAMDQSALLEFAETLRNADGGDMMRMMMAAMLQSLVDAQAQAQIGAARHERTASLPTSGTGRGPRPSPRPVGM
jgi:putative transposase